jgi:probable HAF family extracellular repeat protein
MSMLRRSAIRFSLIVVSLLAIGPASAGRTFARQDAPPGYTISELPLIQPAGADRIAGASAVAINASGDVAGRIEGGVGTDKPSHAVSWRKGEPTWLGAEDEIGSANDINKGRRAVGFVRAGLNAPTTAVVWMKGESTPLENLGGEASVAFAINDENAIVGWSTTAEAGDPARRVHACLWFEGEVTDLGSLGGDDGDSYATDINAEGQIVGGANPQPGDIPAGTDSAQATFELFPGVHAVLWNGDSITDLGTLGGEGSIATAINNNGQIVGSSLQEEGGSRAFLWEDDEMSNLGVLPEGGDASYATDINSAGQVVGLVEGYGDQGRIAFLWQNDEMIDLNTLIPADSDWVLLGATAINDAGQIVGFGLGPEGQQLFLLTPVA